jgi:dCMP deaminase
MPNGCHDDAMPWEREGSFLDTKYPFVCHAELNAILNRAAVTLSGATLYVTLFPCNECAKAIIQSGIRRVVYLENKYAGTDAIRASEMMFRMAGVEYEAYMPSGRQVTFCL